MTDFEICQILKNKIRSEIAEDQARYVDLMDDLYDEPSEVEENLRLLQSYQNKIEDGFRFLTFLEKVENDFLEKQ